MSHYSSNTIVDMSSYVAVTGRPELNCSSVFGLTPQELRYLKVFFFNRLKIQILYRYQILFNINMVSQTKMFVCLFASEDIRD